MNSIKEGEKLAGTDYSDIGNIGNINNIEDILRVQKAIEIKNESDDIYSMRSNPRGYCIIIDNYYGEDQTKFPTRHGSTVDTISLKTVFQQLGFVVIVHQNLNDIQMKQQCHKLSNKRELRTHDAFIAIFLSHGDEGIIYGVNGKSVPIKSLLAYFNNDECPHLANKPKMFFISACRGGEHDEIVAKSKGPLTDASSSLPGWSDMIICYSTIPGYASLRSLKEGTWFGSTLARNIAKHAHVLDLEDILKKVSSEIALYIGSIKVDDNGTEKTIFVKQGTSIEQWTWRKHLYFNPEY